MQRLWLSAGGGRDLTAAHAPAAAPVKPQPPRPWLHSLGTLEARYAPEASMSIACRTLTEPHSRLWWSDAIRANEQAHRRWHLGLPSLWWWGMSADDALASINRTCDRNRVSTIITTVEHELPRRAKLRKRALCIVGGLRTFGMPAVHTNLARVAREWGADVFANVHDRGDFKADPVQYVDRTDRTCGSDPMKLLLAMRRSMAKVPCLAGQLTASSPQPTW